MDGRGKNTTLLETKILASKNIVSQKEAHLTTPVFQASSCWYQINIYESTWDPYGIIKMLVVLQYSTP